MNIRTRVGQLRASGAPYSKTAIAIASVAALTAAAAGFVAWRTLRTERENPPQGSFVYVEGVKLHYVERGSGPALVLLHGNGSMVQDFELSGLIDLAAQRYRVIAFDRPGYGHSDALRARYWDPQEQARVIFKALQELGIERPIVLGHSWGTLPALAMALDYPQDIAGIVLASGFYYPSVRPSVPLLAAPALPVVGTAMRHTVSPLMGRAAWRPLTARLFWPDDIPPRFARFPKWMSLRPSQLRVAAGESASMMPMARRLVARCHELELPVVIMHGEDDKYVSPSWHSERLAKAIPHASLRLVSQVGHMLHYFVPTEVMAAINEVRDESERRDSPLFQRHNLAAQGLGAQ